MHLFVSLEEYLQNRRNITLGRVANTLRELNGYVRITENIGEFKPVVIELFKRSSSFSFNDLLIIEVKRIHSDKRYSIREKKLYFSSRDYKNI